METTSLTAATDLVSSDLNDTTAVQVQLLAAHRGVRGTPSSSAASDLHLSTSPPASAGAAPGLFVAPTAVWGRRDCRRWRTGGTAGDTGEQPADRATPPTAG